MVFVGHLLMSNHKRQPRIGDQIYYSGTKFDHRIESSISLLLIFIRMNSSRGSLIFSRDLRNVHRDRDRPLAFSRLFFQPLACNSRSSRTIVGPSTATLSRLSSSRRQNKVSSFFDHLSCQTISPPSAQNLISSLSYILAHSNLGRSVKQPWMFLAT